jgi:hypothetical protein
MMGWGERGGIGYARGYSPQETMGLAEVANLECQIKGGKLEACTNRHYHEKGAD